MESLFGKEINRQQENDIGYKLKYIIDNISGTTHVHKVGWGLNEKDNLIYILFEDSRNNNKQNNITIKIESYMPATYYINLVEEFFRLLTLCTDYHISAEDKPKHCHHKMNKK